VLILCLTGAIILFQAAFVGYLTRAATVIERFLYTLFGLLTLCGIVTQSLFLALAGMALGVGAGFYQKRRVRGLSL
ncbi:MAG: hypothetical protein Q8P24_14185, partial [Desulfobacterales bacterium]|nr:hypothetical protein [Desulfobacterales bacterium]